MSLQTFGVYDEPKLEKYFSNEFGKYIEQTKSLGNKLKELGYNVKYSHGPVGLYNNISFTCMVKQLDCENLNEVLKQCDFDNSKTYLLYQLIEENGKFIKLRFASIDNKIIKMVLNN